MTEYKDVKAGTTLTLSKDGVFWPAEHMSAVSLMEVAAIWFKWAAEHDWEPRDDRGLIVDPGASLDRLRGAIEGVPT